jgi:excisionase family DNA binding protein
MKESEPKTLTTQQLAEAWNISRWTIYALVRDGKIKPIVGLRTKGWRFRITDLEQLADERL